MNPVEQLAAKVITLAKSRPADAVLREELKSAQVNRQDAGAVADLVFTFFRWRGWVDDGSSIQNKFQIVQELDHRFTSDSNSFTDEELMKAVPSWTSEEVAISRDWLVALQTRPTLWLRAKRGTGRELTRELGHCKPASREMSDALEYTGHEDLFRTPEFHAGEFEVQDVASQWVGLLCAPKPGETWWDACAGEGGKTLHLADLMENKGLIWASDRSTRRLAQLKRRAARAKVFNYRVAPWDGSAKLPTRTMFDGVLIDAPCSGVGTWQRNPHARWTTTMQDVREMAAVQQQLVLNASAAVKPGGKLIYAVCTLTRSETQAVADLCSPQLSGFEPIPSPASTNEPPGASGQKWVWPQNFRGNGMFAAEWKRLL